MRSCGNAPLFSGMLHRGPYLEGYFSALQKKNGRTQIIFCSTLFRNAPPSLTWAPDNTVKVRFNGTEFDKIILHCKLYWFHNYIPNTFNLASSLS